MVSPRVTTYYELITGFLGTAPNSYAPKSFETQEEAEQYWLTEYKNRKKGDGYDEHWNNIPCCIQFVSKVSFILVK
jgi:hypothetical protein